MPLSAKPEKRGKHQKTLFSANPEKRGKHQKITFSGKSPFSAEMVKTSKVVFSKIVVFSRNDENTKKDCFQRNRPVQQNRRKRKKHVSIVSGRTHEMRQTTCIKVRKSMEKRYSGRCLYSFLFSGEAEKVLKNTSFNKTGKRRYQ